MHEIFGWIAKWPLAFRSSSRAGYIIYTSACKLAVQRRKAPMHGARLSALGLRILPSARFSSRLAFPATRTNTNTSLFLSSGSSGAHAYYAHCKVRCNVYTHQYSTYRDRLVGQMYNSYRYTMQVIHQVGIAVPYYTLRRSAQTKRDTRAHFRSDRCPPCTINE